jgi:nucleoside-diphosphate-sugar epimerase
VPKLRAGVPRDRFVHLGVDLADGAATREALRGRRDIDAVFHCANAAVEDARVAILDNLLGGLGDFRSITVLQGMKYYGCHLGPFPTPAREDDARLAENAFYYREEDLIRSACRGDRGWIALRPHSVCGWSPDNPKNLAVALAVYGTLLAEEGAAFDFPGTEKCFDALFAVVDADLLAQAAMHLASDPAFAGRAYNVNNGDVFRWRGIWPRLAAWFGLEPGAPTGGSLADVLESGAPAWERIAARHGLRPLPCAAFPRWIDGDYRRPASRFACEYDLFADTVRLRQTGFSAALRSEAMFLRLFDRYVAEGVIPRLGEGRL